MTVHTVLDDLPPRLVAAQEHVRSTYAAYLTACQHRNGLVVAAVDGGISQYKVAQLLDVSQPTVNRILAKPDVPLVDAA